MQIQFDVTDTPAEFRRNPWTGKTELRVGEHVDCLQNPWSFSAQFNWPTRVVWRRQVGEHEVEIVKVRPRVLGGLRPNSFTVSVDDTLVASATGK